MIFAVQQEIAVGLIKFHLSGFRGFPKDEAGLSVFARCIQECCVSVDHADAVLKYFKDEFPTPREIITTATNLRDKFEPGEDIREKWERDYGKPEPLKVNFSPTPDSDRALMNHKIKERLTAQLGEWKGWAKVSWKQIYEAQEALGYPLNRDQMKMLGR